MRAPILSALSTSLLVLSLSASACGEISPAGLLDTTKQPATLEDASTADATAHEAGGGGRQGDDDDDVGIHDAASEETTDGEAIDASADASHDAQSDGPNDQSDAERPPSGAVACGSKNGTTTYCTPGAACCIQSGPLGQGSVDGGVPACALPNPALCPGVLVACDDDSDCLGLRCCGSLINNSYTIVQCAPACGATQAHMCDPAAPTDVCADEGLTCVPSTRLPGYGHCA